MLCPNVFVRLEDSDKVKLAESVKLNVFVKLGDSVRLIIAESVAP